MGISQRPALRPLLKGQEEGRNKRRGNMKRGTGRKGLARRIAERGDGRSSGDLGD